MRICEHCGLVAQENDVICRGCGATLPLRELGRGAASILQGREEESGGDDRGASRREKRAEYTETLDERDRPQRITRAEAAQIKAPRRRSRVNWALLLTVCFVLAIVGAVGGYAYLKLTDGGQRILARMGREASATAMWEVGEEYMDQGYIERAIRIEEAAYAQEPDREDIYTRLQQLCEAYEAADRPGDAERLYRVMCEKIDETNPVAYQNILRLMRAQNRLMEAAEFLKVAYAKTGLGSFETERLELIPSAPTVAEAVGAGRYKEDKDVELLSAEGNDIYYTIGDDGILPEDGTLYTGPIHLGEGGWTIRAVCVSTELVSDELSAKYVITYPSPDAPYPSLAPGTYNSRTSGTPLTWCSITPSTAPLPPSIRPSIPTRASCCPAA